MAEGEQPTAAEAEPKAKASAASAVQVSKLRDANLKYKNLLKMAKERIQQQENELEFHRGKIFCPRHRLFEYHMYHNHHKLDIDMHAVR
jgi:hypothetical protein